jgi:acyl-coenzyme A synthetase/AMP-(fatty) acid ligase
MGFSWWGDHLLRRGRDEDTWAVSRGVVTYSDLRAKVAEYAAMLEGHGIGPDSKVAVRMSPSFTYLQALLALWSCGAQVVLVDYRMPPPEYEPLLDRVAPQHVVVSTGESAAVAGFQDEAGIVVRPRSGGAARESGFCLVQFSSGSTGRPKVIGRSADSLLAELDRHAAMGLLTGTDRVVILNSVTHTMGLVTGVLHALAVGAVAALPPTRRPTEVLRFVGQTDATAVFGVPAHFDLLNQASRTAATGEVGPLRLAVSGGECVPATVRDEFRAHFGVRIGQVYGVTETGLIAGDPAGNWPPPAVGPPVPGVETRVVGEELYVRLDPSPYIDVDVPDRFVDGWLRTYDRVTQEADTGVLRILGRADSLAIIAGLKVDLTEVEATLLQHPGVAEAVVTHQDIIEAFVAGDDPPGADELIAWCRPRLSPVKIPKRVVVAGALPRNAAGKLIRNRELICDQLAGSEAAV